MFQHAGIFLTEKLQQKSCSFREGIKIKHCIDLLILNECLSCIIMYDMHLLYSKLFKGLYFYHVFFSI